MRRFDFPSCPWDLYFEVVGENDDLDFAEANLRIIFAFYWAVENFFMLSTKLKASLISFRSTRVVVPVLFSASFPAMDLKLAPSRQAQMSQFPSS